MSHIVVVTDPAQVGRENGELTPIAGALTRRGVKAMRARLGQLALMMALLVAVLHPARALVLFGFPHPTWIADVLPVTVAGVALDIATFLVTRRENLRDEDVLRWGLTYFVLRPALLAVVPTRLPTLLGFETPVLSIAYGFVLLFALFLPLDPRRAWQLTPIAVSLQILVGVVTSASSPAPTVLARMIATGAVMVFLVWCCTRIAPSVGSGAASGTSYHLEFLIRREAYGALWLARHRMLARPAGIRTIYPRRWRRLSLPPIEELQRFAKAAASLRSPHAVTLYDYGVMRDGSFYSVAEFLNGEDLRNYVQRVGPLPVREALTYTLDLSEAVVEAHARNLVHRGLVPENVILSRLGRNPRAAKLVKFDLSNIEYYLGAKQSVLRDRTWDAPERLAGDYSGEPSDIYQLGRLLEFMLTGGPASEPAGTAPAAPPLPESLAELIAWCTRQRPEERPHAALLRDQLESALTTLCGEQARTRVLDDLPVAAPTEGTFARRRSTRAPRSAARKASTRPVSEEIREAARHRLCQVAIADVAITMTLTALSRWGFAGNLPTVRRETALIVLTVLSLDLCLWLIATLRRYATSFALEVGAFFFVARAALTCVAVVYSLSHNGIDPPIMTFAPLMVLLLPLFIPLSPKALVLPALVTAAIEPLTHRFLVPPEFAPLWQTSLLSAVTVFVWSQVLARVLYGSREITSEREEFGAYRLGALIGQGGSGEVWRASHDVLERDAALKLLRTDDLLPEQRELWLRRFNREARLTSQLSSPYTVRVYDYGINAVGTAYCVMELLEGENLSSYVKREGHLSPEQTIEIALQICDSLGEAHERGLVHRDIKPANVFLVRSAERVHVKVLDFGLADYAERRPTPSTTGTRLSGTPAFMPPEVFLGQTVDARSDIYELGCLLYYVLSGRKVFERTSFAAMALAHVYDEPELLSTRMDSPLPAELEAIVHRCLSKAPEDRYPSIDELEAALRSVHLAPPTRLGAPASQGWDEGASP